MKMIIAMLILFSFSFGCAKSIHQYNAGDFSHYNRTKKRGELVKVTETKQYIFAKFDNSFVDVAYSKLKNKCKGKKITGVSSNYLTDLGFFSFKERIIFTGYCI